MRETYETLGLPPSILNPPKHSSAYNAREEEYYALLRRQMFTEGLPNEKYIGKLTPWKIGRIEYWGKVLGIDPVHLYVRCKCGIPYHYGHGELLDEGKDKFELREVKFYYQKLFFMYSGDLKSAKYVGETIDRLYCHLSLAKRVLQCDPKTTKISKAKAKELTDTLNELEDEFSGIINLLKPKKHHHKTHK